MRRLFILPVAIASSAFFGPSAFAESVATDAVGFTTVECLAQADTFVSVPFTKVPEFVGSLQSISGNVLTFADTPFQGKNFIHASNPATFPTHFVLIGPHASTNPKEGRHYTITADTDNTVTVDPEGEDLSGISAQTQISIIPYHTLGTLFPDTDAGVSFHPSGSAAVRPTEILIPNYAGVGVNLAAAATYYYLDSTDEWRKVGDGTVNHDAAALVNGGYFLQRNRNIGGVANSATKLTRLGGVLYRKLTVPLETNPPGSPKQDNFVSVTRPVDVKLDDLGLISSGAFANSPSGPAVRTDELLVFNNAAPGLNKSAAATYWNQAGVWRKVGDSAPLPNRGTDVIPAGTGFIIRKGTVAGGPTIFWPNAATYTNTP